MLHFRFSILSLFLPILVNRYLELYFKTDSGYSFSPIRHLVWQIEATEIEDINGRAGKRILFPSAESPLTRERYFQHEKIKFVSPSGHVMFWVFFYRY